MPTLQLLYNPGEYIPSPIAPEGVPTVSDTATMGDLSPEIKALLERNEQRVKERNQREYEEHRRKTDVRFTGEKPLQTEDHLFAGALVGGYGLLTRAGSVGLLPAVAEEIGGTVGGAGMGYLGNKTGNIIDTRLGTTWATPTFSFLGGLFGGASGVNKGYKTAVNLGSKGILPKGGELLYKNQFRSDVLGNVLSKANMISSSNAPLRHYMRWSLNDGDAHQTNVYDMLTGKDIGQISTQVIDGGVDRVRRIQGEPEYKWKGRSLYSAEIMETPRGLVSGENLEMPEATVPTWKHFDHEVIGDYGLHGNVSGQPVVRLKYAETYLPKAEPKVIDYIEQTVPVSGNTSYKFFEKPSTYFKDATYAGNPRTYAGKEVPTWQLPKGQRNQVTNVRTLSQEYANNYISAKMNPRKPTWDYEDLMENYFRDNFADEFNKRLKEYVSYARLKQISPHIDDSIVKGYRNYLNHLEFDAKDLSDEELRIILSKHFTDLSKGASGKMKDQIVWHSSPTWFDEFDYRHTGENMENSGAMGPGNYFSKEAAMYGRGKRLEYSGKYPMGNTQPYVITDVMSTPSGKDMQDKGLLPIIIQKYRGRDKYGQKWDPDPEFDTKLKAQIDAVPSNDNKMYVLKGTDSGFDKLYQTPFGIPGGELMIRRNTGIKSLYPHPSRFVRDEDGFVHLIPTDWNDPRVNFKTGGKL